MKKLLITILAAAALVVPTSQAMAAKPSSITIDQTGPFHIGDRITFTVSTTRTDQPWVYNECRQGGSIVLQEYKGLYPEYYDPDHTFTLGPTVSWTAGPADCTATLFLMTGKTDWMKELATVDYSVVG